MISSLVALTILMSSTAKAGYEMMASTPASTSLEMDALGNMDVRMDWWEYRHILKSKEADELPILIFNCVHVPGTAVCHQPERGPKSPVLPLLQTGWVHPAPPELPEGHKANTLINNSQWKEGNCPLLKSDYIQTLFYFPKANNKAPLTV